MNHLQDLSRKPFMTQDHWLGRLPQDVSHVPCPALSIDSCPLALTIMLYRQQLLCFTLEDLLRGNLVVYHCVRA